MSPLQSFVGGGTNFRLEGTGFPSVPILQVRSGTDSANFVYLGVAGNTFSFRAPIEPATGSRKRGQTTAYTFTIHFGTVQFYTNDDFTYLSPDIIRINPSEQLLMPVNKYLTIDGNSLNLDDDPMPVVSFGGVRSTNVITFRSSQIVCQIPYYPNQNNVAITVTFYNGLTITAGGLFSYYVPQLTGITPAQGLTGVANTFTLNGQYMFDDAGAPLTQVYVAGARCPAVTWISSTQVQCTIAPVVVAEGGFNRQAITMMIGPQAVAGTVDYTIYYITPKYGVANGGNRIKVTGVFLRQTTAATIGGSNCIVDMATVIDTEFYCQTGAYDLMGNDHAVFPLLATIDGGVYSSPVAIGEVFTYYKPTIATIAPNEGYISGGTLITIDVAYFPVIPGTVAIGSVLEFQIGGVKFGAPQPVTFTLYGHHYASMETFTYFEPTISAQTPADSIPLGGATLTIDGTHLDVVTRVFIDNAEVSLCGITAAQITCPLPAKRPGTYPVKLYVGATLYMSPTTIDYIGPAIDSIVPSQGSKKRVYQVTLTGLNFGIDPTKISVTIGPDACLPIALLPTGEVICTRPAGNPGVQRVTVNVIPAGSVIPVATMDDISFTSNQLACLGSVLTDGTNPPTPWWFTYKLKGPKTGTEYLYIDDSLDELIYANDLSNTDGPPYSPLQSTYDQYTDYYYMFFNDQPGGRGPQGQRYNNEDFKTGHLKSMVIWDTDVVTGVSNGIHILHSNPNFPAYSGGPLRYYQAYDNIRFLGAPDFSQHFFCYEFNTLESVAEYMIRNDANLQRYDNVPDMDTWTPAQQNQSPYLYDLLAPIKGWAPRVPAVGDQPVITQTGLVAACTAALPVNPNPVNICYWTTPQFMIAGHRANLFLKTSGGTAAYPAITAVRPPGLSRFIIVKNTAAPVYDGIDLWQVMASHYQRKFFIEMFYAIGAKQADSTEEVINIGYLNLPPQLTTSYAPDPITGFIEYDEFRVSGKSKEHAKMAWPIYPAYGANANNLNENMINRAAWVNDLSIELRDIIAGVTNSHVPPRIQTITAATIPDAHDWLAIYQALRTTLNPVNIGVELTLVEVPPLLPHQQDVMTFVADDVFALFLTSHDQAIGTICDYIPGFTTGTKCTSAIARTTRLAEVGGVGPTVFPGTYNAAYAEYLPLRTFDVLVNPDFMIIQFSLEFRTTLNLAAILPPFQYVINPAIVTPIFQPPFIYLPSIALCAEELSYLMLIDQSFNQVQAIDDTTIVYTIGVNPPNWANEQLFYRTAAATWDLMSRTYADGAGGRIDRVNLGEIVTWQVLLGLVINLKPTDDPLTFTNDDIIALSDKELESLSLAMDKWITINATNQAINTLLRAPKAQTENQPIRFIDDLNRDRIVSVTFFLESAVSSNLPNLYVNGDFSAYYLQKPIGYKGSISGEYEGMAIALVNSKLCDIQMMNMSQFNSRLFDTLCPQAGPQITSLPTLNGPVYGHYQIIVNGYRFNSGLVVRVGDVDCLETAMISSTSLGCRVPPGIDQHHLVSLYQPSYAYFNLQASKFYFSYDAPTINAIWPIIADSNGGSLLTVAGSNFGNQSHVVQVTIDKGLSECSPIQSVNDTMILCWIPIGTGTDRPIQVTVGSQSTSFSLNNLPKTMFNYEGPRLDAFVPTSADANDYMIIHGDGFGIEGSDLPVLLLDQKPVELVNFTNNYIMFKLDNRVSSVPVVIQSADQIIPTPSTFTYLPPYVSYVDMSFFNNQHLLIINGYGFGLSPYDIDYALLSNQPISCNPFDTFMECQVDPSTPLTEKLVISIGGQQADMSSDWFGIPEPYISDVTTSFTAPGQGEITIVGEYFLLSSMPITITNSYLVVNLTNGFAGQLICPVSSFINENLIICAIPAEVNSVQVVANTLPSNVYMTRAIIVQGIAFVDLALDNHFDPDQGDYALSGAAVYLTRGGVILRQTYTDLDGWYSFNNLLDIPYMYLITVIPASSLYHVERNNFTIPPYNSRIDFGIFRDDGPFGCIGFIGQGEATLQVQYGIFHLTNWGLCIAPQQCPFIMPSPLNLNLPTDCMARLLGPDIVSIEINPNLALRFYLDQQMSGYPTGILPNNLEMFYVIAEFTYLGVFYSKQYYPDAQATISIGVPSNNVYLNYTIHTTSANLISFARNGSITTQPGVYVAHDYGLYELVHGDIYPTVTFYDGPNLSGNSLTLPVGIFSYDLVYNYGWLNRVQSFEASGIYDVYIYAYYLGYRALPIGRNGVVNIPSFYFVDNYAVKFEINLRTLFSSVNGPLNPLSMFGGPLEISSPYISQEPAFFVYGYAPYNPT
eukprot:gene7380-8600_t